ncbi:class A beta-lactamase [Nocardia terpenica]|uniref:class A beta-lactamase n=1 Tax=Nocardia terpenica TaxID=455432 RepID=UPI001894B854|nr:class A beta-lactamase [Nocardia terpenica]MBF6059881.1 class A beta-lactamase [Nocardia terpenica]MBF6102578.1 class A beta-lactamase [Nocardia terpenica]MBF6111231.1 class A beta-lactamase [Nocardia terpenica]MBF6117362.1 class A beta-lactamase [Nocardia terpenica]MBF6150797.1 class A beta-lactamase [Nocardia terpenica]
MVIGPDRRVYDRRRMLTAALLVPAAGYLATAAGSAAAPDTGSAAPLRPDPVASLAELERRYGARLGVFAVATGTGATLAYRADDRFAMCSTFKALAAAAVLSRNPLSHLDTRVTFTRDEIRSISPVTERHVDTGMTIGQLCDAAIRYSDGTAGNLLLDDIGGPAALTTYLRTLGDPWSRMDNYEPELNRDAPGDERDTSTPRALATDYRTLVLGTALSPEKRGLLTDWLLRSTTGTGRICGAVPGSWPVAHKTGTGDYGRANDVAIIYPPSTPPLVLAIMSDISNDYNAQPSDQLIAEAATRTLTTLCA